MRIPQDARFRREREAFGLKFTCEDCSHFDPRPRAERGGRSACCHGYPTDGHREARYADPDADLLFCKDFDLA